MDVAVWIMSDRSWEGALATARWAEATGYHSLWYADHLMPFRADGSSDGGDTLECWTVLAAIAAAVPRLRLVSMVSPVSIHHPVLLAKRAVVTDQISGGRAVLGLGAGWQENEHTAYGFPLLAPGARVDRFAEAIEIIHRLTRGERLTLDGAYYQLADAPLAPGPRSGSLPLLVGSGGQRMLRLTARWADEWNTWGDPDEVGRRTQRFFAACDAENRDPSTIRRSAQAIIYYVRTAAERTRAEQKATPNRTLIGGASELIDQINRYAELGVDEFAIGDYTFGETREQRMEMFATFHADVIAKL